MGDSSKVMNENIIYWRNVFPSPRVLNTVEVNDLFRRSWQDFGDQVNEALLTHGDQDDTSKVNALRHYMNNAVQARHKIGRNALHQRAGQTAEEISEAAGKIEWQVPLSLGREFMRIADEKRYERAYDELFQQPTSNGELKQTDRIYIPMSQSCCSDVQDRVSKALFEKGFHIADYAKGYAEKEGKNNKYNIGKLLKDNPVLQDDFRDDEARQNYYIVLSRHPYDILRMSTGRKWSSCTAYGDEGFEPYCVPDLTEGALVAYLVSPHDPGVRNPLSRIVLKPYEDEGGDILLLPNLSYTNGMKCDRFAEVLQGFIEEKFNKGKHGHYYLKEKVFRDKGPGAVLRLSNDTSLPELFDLLDVEYKEIDGRFVVDGDLDLSESGVGLGWYALPDLTDVVVKGDLILDRNPLHSFKGAPEVEGNISAKAVPLVSAEGLPKGFKTLITEFGEYQGFESIPERFLDPKRHIPRNQTLMYSFVEWEARGELVHNKPQYQDPEFRPIL
jgi:hypothetical protein